MGGVHYIVILCVGKASENQKETKVFLFSGLLVVRDKGVTGPQKKTHDFLIFFEPLEG